MLVCGKLHSMNELGGLTRAFSCPYMGQEFFVFRVQKFLWFALQSIIFLRKENYYERQKNTLQNLS